MGFRLGNSGRSCGSPDILPIVTAAVSRGDFPEPYPSGFLAILAILASWRLIGERYELRRRVRSPTDLDSCRADDALAGHVRRLHLADHKAVLMGIGHGDQGDGVVDAGVEAFATAERRSRPKALRAERNCW
jgi:hypothetical protein